MRKALKIAPAYWRNTFYAITDQRVLLVIDVDWTRSVVLEYFPHDIDGSVNVVRSDGSGAVTFSAARELKVGKYEPAFKLSGSFVGISDVQHVADLLLQLKTGEVRNPDFNKELNAG